MSYVQNQTQTQNQAQAVTNIPNDFMDTLCTSQLSVCQLSMMIQLTIMLQRAGKDEDIIPSSVLEARTGFHAANIRKALVGLDELNIIHRRKVPNAQGGGYQYALSIEWDVAQWRVSKIQNT